LVVFGELTMVAIIGIVVSDGVPCSGCYILHGGNRHPMIEAAPLEIMFAILGAGIGGMLVGNSHGHLQKVAMAGTGQSIQRPCLQKEDYLSHHLSWCPKCMKTLKAEAPVALEAHIENPESSASFCRIPKFCDDHALLDLVIDNTFA
jgi:chemotaxis protein MotA